MTAPGTYCGTTDDVPIREVPFEIGMDEAYKSRVFEKDGILFANNKRTYDEYQQVSLDGIRAGQRHVEDLHASSLEDARRTRHHFDKLVSDAQQNDNQRQQLSLQALQNALTTQDMLAKRALGHHEVATDRQWNPDEVASVTAKTGLQQDAIVAAVVAAVLAKLSDQPKS